MNRDGRQPSIDFLKTAAIVSVVWIHAYLTFWRPPEGPVRFLAAFTRFAVPAFFFASGFLAFRPGPVGAADLKRRFSRLLLPYIVASLVAVAGRWVAAGPIPLSRVGWELLTGDAVGIYYFMLPLWCATLLVVPLSRWPSMVAPLLLVAVVAGWLVEVGIIRIGGATPADIWFWYQRNPLRWLPYFIAGWFVAKEHGAIRALTQPRRSAAGAVSLLVAILLCFAVAYAPIAAISSSAFAYLGMYAATFGIFLLAHDWRAPAAVRWMSDATYPIYLYHFFFIAAFRHLWRAAGLDLRLGLSDLAIDSASFVVAWLGSLTVIWLGRRLLGPHARLAIG